MEDNKITNETVVNEETEKETVTEEVKEEVMAPKNEPNIVVGVVSGCSRLYIRKGPNKDTDPIIIVNVDTEMEIINPDRPNTDWYRVNVYENDKVLKGFCMKEFVTLY